MTSSLSKRWNHESGKVEAKTSSEKYCNAGVFKKETNVPFINMIYRRKRSPYYMKRFSVTGVTRNTEL